MNKQVLAGVLYLRERDSVLRDIIDRVGPCSLRPSHDYYGSLARTIISQQLSAKAADTILSRLQMELGGKLMPSAILNLSDSQFAKAGISRQKKSYLVQLAVKFGKGEINTDAFREQDDEKLIKYLEGIRGIGRWSAEMFLIFCLNRLNILPLDDVVVKRAVLVSYELRKSPSERILKRISAFWDPYKSIAVWYLWQSIDGNG
jgi:DNA-3-methyladenine glycosylase II